jgi:hypothetical protein
VRQSEISLLEALVLARSRGDQGVILLDGIVNDLHLREDMDNLKAFRSRLASIGWLEMLQGDACRLSSFGFDRAKRLFREAVDLKAVAFDQLPSRTAGNERKATYEKKIKHGPSWTGTLDYPAPTRGGEGDGHRDS